MSDFGTLRQPDGPGLHAFFFDVLHVDGSDVIDEPLAQRGEVLHAIAPDLRIPAIITADPIEAQRFAESSQRAGHEGVMVKSLRSLYEAGRRGSSWRKVKPVLTVDLVVLAAEWGHGRRQGWLSNLHLGAAGGDPARQPASADDAAAMEFVMVGKTFKGLTDAMLTWQTEQFLAREIGREGHVVYVRPELVVEIALDGVQRSSRYPGGVALRFARVKRYRTDKSPLDVDRIERLQAMRDGG
jgi:DNA ligase-1